MTAKLSVSSDCKDTCFYMRISIAKERGNFGHRDNITSLCYKLGDYVSNIKAGIILCFYEHAFLIKKGQRLRIDISSANSTLMFVTQTTKAYTANKPHQKLQTTLFISEISFFIYLLNN